MQTAKQITGVKCITNIAKPIIVFQLNGHPDVARNPKQALTDLQNSGRALNVQSVNDPAFIKAIHACVGATLNGDLRSFKAGDEYAIAEGHPALTDTKHPLFGKVKIGDKQRAENDGVWVEGFLSIPETLAERQMSMNANAYADIMAQFMGFGAPVATNTAVAETFVPEGVTPEAEIVAEVTGKPAKAN